MAVLIYDSVGQPYAKGYYEIFKSEPYASGASLIVTKMESVGTWHLPGLLRAIVTHGADEKDLLIAGHGTTAGLSIPLAEGKDRNVGQYLQLTVLMSDKSVKEKASRCEITEEEVNQILRLRAQVLKLKLGRIEFRVCNMGQSITSLAGLKNFLGAGIVGAPDILDFFGTLDFGKPTKDAKIWTDWLKAHPKAQIYNMPGGKVAVYRLLQFSCQAETSQAVTDWIKASLPASKAEIDIVKVPVHALLGGTFIFPNESGYVKHIKHYSKGNPLLQEDPFGPSGALRIPDADWESRIIPRVARQYPGSVGRDPLPSGQAQSRRGPVGMA